mgnify:FL=1
MIEIKVDTDQLERSLTQLSQRLVHRRPLMKKLAAVMHNAVDENFEAEGRPKWLGIKHRQGRVLRDSGALQNSISERSDDDTAIVGTNLPYAAIHQFGGEIKRAARSQQAYFHQKKDGSVGNRFVKKSRSNFSQWVTIGSGVVNMPARPYLSLTNEDEAEIVDTVNRYLSEVLG